MRRIFLLLALLISILAIVILGACTSDKEKEITTGTIIIGVTDQPDKNISSITVTTDLIEASINTATAKDGESSWQMILNEKYTFDLIEVAGIEDILGESDVPAATYNQIRMHVASVMVTLEGQEIEASIPSGTIKLVRPIEIKAGEETVVTFDFDAEKSVVVTGAGEVIFKPTVKLLVRKGNEPFQANQNKVTQESENTEPLTLTPDDGQEVTDLPELPPMTQGDEEDFFLNITSPEQSEVIVDKDSIVISGETSVDAAVSIGNDFIEVDLDGTFESTIELEDGINIIEVVASIPSGEQFNQIITVIYIPEEE